MWGRAGFREGARLCRLSVAVVGGSQGATDRHLVQSWALVSGRVGCGHQCG